MLSFQVHAGSLIVLLLPIWKELYVDLYAYRFYFSTSFKMNSKNVGSMCGQTIKAPWGKRHYFGTIGNKVCYYSLYNDVNATRVVIGRRHDLSEYRYMDDVTRNLVCLFCSTWRAVLKMFVRLFRIKASEILEKSSTEAIYKKQKWRNGDKKSSWLL